jgi:two-component system, OmpR family, alkaline phosphatase synthesis response regulator PhoP
VSGHSGISTPIVLVADDSRTVLSMVTSRLERRGYEVVTAANGEDALQLARQRVPTLVILDVEMPGIDGLEVTRRLRAEPATSEVPIVLLTSLDEEMAVVAGFAAGATGYITKPFSPQELEDQIDGILGRR